MDNFDVTVTCDTNYESTGIGPVASVCSADAAQYYLSGCNPKDFKPKITTLELDGDYANDVGLPGTSKRTEFETNFKTDLLDIFSTGAFILTPITINQIVIKDIQPGSIKVKFTINNPISNEQIISSLRSGVKFTRLSKSVQSTPTIEEDGINKYLIIGGILCLLCLCAIILFYIGSSSIGAPLVANIGRPIIPRQIAYR